MEDRKEGIVCVCFQFPVSTPNSLDILTAFLNPFVPNILMCMQKQKVILYCSMCYNHRSSVVLSIC